MTTARATWRVVLESYPCPKCGAQPRQPCRTGSGRPTFPHADRARWGDRCPVCGQVVDNGHPGALCGRCALVRALEVERATTWKRET